jgi:hypothetical protein
MNSLTSFLEHGMRNGEWNGRAAHFREDARVWSPVSIAKVYDGIAAVAQPGGKNAALEENKV